MTRLCGPWPADLTDCAAPAGGLEEHLEAATEVLWALSGRRFGSCTATFRPCSGADVCTPIVDRAWAPLATCRCSTSCGHRLRRRLLLPNPVVSVGEVKVDGAVVPASEYRLESRRWLARLGGSWPATQNLDLPDTEAGTWSVTITWGQPVPAAGLLAAAQLACEFYKAVAAPDDCGLPARLTTITRQGLTMTVLDPADFLKEGKTGITSIDLWLAAVNPARLHRAARIFRADDDDSLVATAGPTAPGATITKYGGY